MTQRLTVGYAFAVTLTVAAALCIGRWLLDGEMTDHLNLLHDMENTEVVQDLGGDMEELPEAELVRRMQAHSEADEELFFFQVHDDTGRVWFRSPSLGDSLLPDLSAIGPRWTTNLPPRGRIYTSEYEHGRLRLQIGSRLEPTERLLRRYTQISLVLVLLVAAGSLGLGYGISRLALRPLRDIQRTASRIGVDNLSERVPVPPGHDEVTELVRLLNATFDRLEAAFRQVRQFSADASHELKTPLTLIRLNAERLRTLVAENPGAIGAVDSLLEEIARMHRLIETLLFLAKAESGVLQLAREEQEIRDWFESVAEDAAVLAEDRDLKLIVECNDAGAARFDRDLMRQLVLNLVSNAVAVMDAGAITLRSTLNGGRWRIAVMDEGPGLPDDQLDRIFERFVQLPRLEAAPVGGHGLGLAICRGIARLHGGEVRAAHRHGRSGLQVTVDLPV